MNLDIKEIEKEIGKIVKITENISRLDEIEIRSLTDENISLLQRVADIIPKENLDAGWKHGSIENAELWYRAGQLTQILQMLEHAEKYFLFSMKIFQEFEKPWGNLARIYEAWDEDNKAAECWLKAEKGLNNAIQRNPNDYDSLNALAFLHYSIKKDYKKAEEIWLEILNSNPDYHDVLVNLAIFYENVNEQFEKAIEYYKRYLKIKPENENIHRSLQILKGKMDTLDNNGRIKSFPPPPPN